ncbi:right-handed parallel beta-helix repeat-containing protein [Candidatus Micrarchaeota archaeon]|nr:right-handed parallel beta-helix repeat-containing protein [Candidatus Micrarchaeota archaeon]
MTNKKKFLMIFLIIGSLSFATMSIDSCQNLTIAGETYLLTEDISTDEFYCINILGKDITLDCQNYKIQGIDKTYSIGIKNEGFDGVVVKNCKVSGFEYGITFSKDADHGEIRENYLSDNYAGIYLEFNCTNNKIIKNQLDDNSNGIIIMFNCTDNQILENTINNSWSGNGIYLNNCENNIIQDNKADGNAFGIYLDGMSNKNEVKYNTVNNNGVGFVISSSSNNQITGNTARFNENGIVIEWGSKNNYIDNNQIKNNTDYGFYFQDDGSDNELQNNIITNNARSDLYFEYSASGNFGNNVCDTVEDINKVNQIVCSGTGTAQNGQNTGMDGNGGSNSETPGETCCLPMFVLVLISGLYVMKK